MFSHIDVALSQRQRSLSRVTFDHRFELTIPGTGLFISGAYLGPIEIFFPGNLVVEEDFQPEQTETLGVVESRFQTFVTGVEWDNSKL